MTMSHDQTPQDASRFGSWVFFWNCCHQGQEWTLNCFSDLRVGVCVCVWCGGRGVVALSLKMFTFEIPGRSGENSRCKCSSRVTSSAMLWFPPRILAVGWLSWCAAPLGSCTITTMTFNCVLLLWVCTCVPAGKWRYIFKKRKDGLL